MNYIYPYIYICRTHIHVHTHINVYTYKHTNISSIERPTNKLNLKNPEFTITTFLLT